uniref:CG10617 n=1 Tax=Macrostomum lignano TaxID=282301 RepID=A0A1I8HN39_9PLAT
AAALLISTGGGQHQLQHQQQTPDLCRRSENCLELRHLPQAGRGADGPVGGPFGRSSVHPPHHLGGGHLGLGGGRGFMGEPLLLDHPGGASPNPPGHFRNISSSGLYPPGTPPSYQPGAAAAAIGASSRGLASPPRVDAPDFSSGKLSSPHSSLSSSIGSPSKRRPSTSAAAAVASAAAPTLMLASLGNGRSVNVTPDILNPPVARPSRSLHGGNGGSGGDGGSGEDAADSSSQ